MNQEQSEPIDLGISSMKSSSREQQDSYRKTLAASWVGSHGELPADQCIEDIFSGGDGWGNRDGRDSAGFVSSDADYLQVPLHSNHKKLFSSGGRGHYRQRSQSDKSDAHNRGQGGGTSSGRSSPDPTPHSSSSDDHVRTRKRMNEVSEMDLREDLRSWEIRTTQG